MKKTVVNIIIIFICASQMHPVAYAQNDTDPAFQESQVFNEEFQLFTDRNIYAANEKVFFRAFNLSPRDLKKTDWSKVLYVEIINQLNTPVAQAKFSVDKYGTSGYLKIPENTPTGIYIIRAYTKWMRNFSPVNYFHNVLSIINPVYNEMKNGEENTGTNTYAPESHSEMYRNAIPTSTNKKIYSKREEIEITISIPESGNLSPDGYCISVIKKGVLDTNNYRLNLDGSKNNVSMDDLYYFPETRGLSISGKVINKVSKDPLNYARIHMGVLGNNADYFGALINESGRFRFPLPQHKGFRDIYITAETNNDVPAEIQIDDDFSKDFAQIPVPAYNSISKRSELIREIMINMQVDKLFRQSQPDIKMIEKEEREITKFYGEPFLNYKTRDYIELPNLEEFFFELIPSVKLKGKKGNRYFTLLGRHTLLSTYKPLVLLDNVPIVDIEPILPVSPEKIDYIDIINTNYIKGYMHFGGIINIISKEGNRAGIKIPQNSRLFSFRSFEPQSHIEYPDYNTDNYNERIPDFRNCLFWEPNLKIGNNKKTTVVKFFTSDNQGEYVAVVRGITDNGKIVEGQCNFVVK